MTTISHLERLTSTQQRDVDKLIEQMQRRLEEVRVAPSVARRKEAGEWVLRVAAEIYTWSR